MKHGGDHGGYFDQRGGPEIHRSAISPISTLTVAIGKDKAEEELAGPGRKPVIPPGEKEDREQSWRSSLGWKLAKPVPRSTGGDPLIRFQASILGREAEDEEEGGAPENDPPPAFPEVVVDERADRTGDEADAQPEALAFDEVVRRLRATQAGEGARAEEHDDPERHQSRDDEQEDVDAVTLQNGGECSQRERLFIGYRNLEFLADLKFARVGDAVELRGAPA